ncbi:holo-ACP synthase [Tsukamurella sp. 1534]|uniref:holo-ACP synthase n=1 Tax=Tsukamurella sp. 1534 TaxID=1151061 RepID=UPI0002F401A7|nr:4'-phosphopantetheinyl transferase superfamily protein [Tsukamurella sp. 1534]
MNGIGIDLVAIGDVEYSLAEFGDRFLRRVFTGAERRECAGDARRLAARLAAKEAAIKALRPGPEVPTPPREIEVVTTPYGPELRLHGGLAARARARGWREPRVSLSHTDCHAVAVVTVEVS